MNTNTQGFASSGQTSTYGYGLTAFPPITGTKAITKPEVAGNIMVAFGNLEKNLSSIPAMPGSEVQLAKLWGQLSAIRADFVEFCSGNVGHA